MEVIEKKVRHGRGSTFKIYPIGDIHGGSPDCSESLIRSQIERISQEDNAYIIGMGDYIECILKDDKRFDMKGLADWVKQDDIIESQRKWIRELFFPVKDKILVMLTGNHEETEHRLHQNDITRHVCEDLGVPYGGYHCFLNLRFERRGGARHIVTIHAWHGAGSAQTEGARIMRLMRLVNDIQADIYLMGHLHAITLYNPDRLICRDGRIKSVSLVACMTGSWLKAYNQPDEGQYLNPSYAEQKGYKPNRLGCPIIHIKPQTRKFTVEV